jgi:hypothetical protein
MKQKIGKFIAKLRKRLLTKRVEREIYHKIFRHINRHGDFGYPFSSGEGLLKSRLEGFIQARKTLHDIDRAAGRMQEAEGNAFRYIVARDLNERMEMYMQFAHERQCSGEGYPCAVVTAS